MAPRVLAVWLDGFDVELARSLIARGELRALAALESSSAVFHLDHGAGRLTGLAGEHLATGRSPEDADRWSAVHFDPASYACAQQGTTAPPLAAQLPCRIVAVDPPYFDLGQAPGVTGVVGWGAHDPGAPAAARPAGLADEIAERVGAYPAQEFIYGLPWPSTATAAEMGATLTEAAHRRTDLARWLLTERLPEWDLALVAVSEPHSVLEGLWYGVDEHHPLHRVPSAAAAGEGVRSVLAAVDRLVGELVDAVPHDALAVYSLHGMGPNRSDVQSMVLLPELLHRWAFGSPRFEVPRAWRRSDDGVVPFDVELGWSDTLRLAFHGVPRPGSAAARVRRLVGRPVAPPPRTTDSMRWMPGMWYRDEWPGMRAFALPSFYDGRIRLNVRGREAAGLVEPSDRDAVLDELEALLSECTDAYTGEPVMERFERWRPGDGSDVGPTEVDALVTWTGTTSALRHPTLGLVGPVPYRRGGGHSRTEGVAWLRAPGLEPGDHGWRSSFDVVPTLVDLLELDAVPGTSGSSLLPSRAPSG